jgi:hypothetical protein
MAAFGGHHVNVLCQIDRAIDFKRRNFLLMALHSRSYYLAQSREVLLVLIFVFLCRLDCYILSPVYSEVYYTRSRRIIVLNE